MEVRFKQEKQQEHKQKFRRGLIAEDVQILWTALESSDMKDTRRMKLARLQVPAT